MFALTLRHLSAVLFGCLVCSSVWAAPPEKSVAAVSGSQREYQLLLPERAPKALVVLLHGIGTDAAFFQQAGFSGWVERYRRDGFAFLIPEARDASPTLKRGANIYRAWNGGDPQAPSDEDCCFSLYTRFLNMERKKARQSPLPYPAPPDDLQAVWQLIDRSAKKLDLSTERVAVIGISNGGILAYRMQCNLPEGSLGAVISIQGSLTGAARCKGGGARDFLHIHGDQDVIVPFAGGKTMIAPLEPDYVFTRSPEDSLRAIAKAAGCSGPERTFSGKADVAARSNDAIETAWTLRTLACGQPASRQHLLVFHGVGHEARISMFRTALEFARQLSTPKQSDGVVSPAWLMRVTGR